MQQEYRKMQYIDLFSCLSLSDYYRADLHWRQECLQPVVAQLAHSIAAAYCGWIGIYHCGKVSFLGHIFGQAALPLAPEELIYLTNAAIEDAVVYYQIIKNMAKFMRQRVWPDRFL